VLSIQVPERSLLPAKNYALRLELIAGPRNSGPAIGMLYSQGSPKLPNWEWERESLFTFTAVTQIRACRQEIRKPFRNSAARLHAYDQTQSHGRPSITIFVTLRNQAGRTAPRHCTHYAHKS
jgi:hypothetical protein